jgi:hypothetical protein
MESIIPYNNSDGEGDGVGDSDSHDEKHSIGYWYNEEKKEGRKKVGTEKRSIKGWRRGFSSYNHNRAVFCATCA